MEFANNWYSNLGFYIELIDNSPIISGNFHILSKKIDLKGVAVRLQDDIDISFIINWNSNALTAFSGKLIKENLLNLKWLLFMEDKSLSKKEQYNGELFLTNFIPAKKSYPDTQIVLPYPKILLADALSYENPK